MRWMTWRAISAGPYRGDDVDAAARDAAQQAVVRGARAERQAGDARHGTLVPRQRAQHGGWSAATAAGAGGGAGAGEGAAV